MIFFTLVVVKYMEKNLDVTKPRYRGQFASPLAHCCIEVLLQCATRRWTPSREILILFFLGKLLTIAYHHGVRDKNLAQRIRQRISSWGKKLPTISDINPKHSKNILLISFYPLFHENVRLVASSKVATFLSSLRQLQNKTEWTNRKLVI